MPRIEAPTVREHHDQRRERLLEAARACLLDPAIRSVGFEHVGPRAGIRRNSVYLYFPSETHLYLALAESDVPALAKQLAEAAATAHDKLAAIVDLVLASAPREEFELLRRLASRTASQRPDLVTARLGELRRELAQPLVSILADDGVSSPDVVGLLALGTLEAALDAIVQGEDRAAVREAVLATLRGPHTPRG